ncbi:MAG: signal peptidase II [Chlamydiales bacterium]|nr:signal peptidase II [Chlamydiales bacterium]
MNRARTFQYIAIALVIIALDGILKALIHLSIPLMGMASVVYPYGGIGILHNWHGIDFSITHVINRGAAWGAFSSFHDLLLYLRMAIIGGLLTYLWIAKTDPFRSFCLMLVAAGAIGNVIDHFLYGHVVDMFYFVFWGYSYPVFNLADASIFCGIAFLLLKSFFSRSSRTSLKKT